MAWNGGNLILTKMILMMVIFLVRILMMVAVAVAMVVVVAKFVLDEYSSCHVSFLAVMV